MNEIPKIDTQDIPKLSTGDLNTLGTYLRIAKALAPGSKFEHLINTKIAESPNGEDEIVIAAESQMMYLLGQMLDLYEETTEKEEMQC